MGVLEAEGKCLEAAELMAAAYVQAQTKYLDNFDNFDPNENPNMISSTKVVKPLHTMDEEEEDYSGEHVVHLSDTSLWTTQHACACTSKIGSQLA